MLVFQHRQKICFGRTVIALLLINRLKKNWSENIDCATSYSNKIKFNKSSKNN